MNLARPFAAASAIAFLAAFAAAQQPLEVIEGSSQGSNFGASLAVLDDVDGDGIDDVAVGIPFDNTAGVNAGAVRVISGADGSTIRTVYGQAAGERFGHCVVSVGRGSFVDPMFAASAPFASPNGASSGQVRVVKAATGAVTHTLNGSAAGDRFGWSVISFGGPGIFSMPLLAIGAPYDNTSTGGSDSGSVTIRYMDGTVPPFSPSALPGSQAGQHFGWTLGTRTFGSGSGLFLLTHTQLMIGSPDYDGAAGTSTGRVDVWEMSWQTATGGLSGIVYVAGFDGPFAGSRAGYAVAGLQGADSDFAVGVPDDGTGIGLVYLVHMNASSISTHKLLSGIGGFGLSVANANQLGGNNDDDVLVGAPLALVGSLAKGKVFAYDGSTGNLLGTMNGTITGGHYGEALATHADFDGDGTHDDFVIGSPDAAIDGADQGRVELRNALSGFGAIVASAEGVVSGDGFGRSVAGVGDVNGDGVPDWIVGSPNDSQTIVFPAAGVIDGVGSARVVSGKDGATIRTHFGADFGDELGWSVAALGDVNLDGVPDYAIGAPQRNAPTSQTGYARVCSGANGAQLFALTGVTADSEFGFSVGGGSDVNGDGRPDILVGAPGTPNGSVLSYSGASGLLIGTLTGQAAGDRFGQAVAGLGADLNGDGKQELIVGAPLHDSAGTSAGRVYVMRSASAFLTKWIFDGDAAGDALGTSVARAGDLNGDGTPDIVAGAPNHDTLPFGANSGLARAWSGATGAVLFTSGSASQAALLGTSVSGVGDVDLDGYADIAIGAPQGPLGFSTLGFVRIVSGRTGAIVFTATGSNINEGLGSSVSGAGDLDLDGIPDLVAGAPNDDSHGPNSGLARAISLRALGVKFFGSIPPGCTGPSLLSTFGVPSVGNASFEYRANHAPPSSLGLLLIANAKEPFPNGVDLFGLGAPFLIDPLLSTLLVGLDMPTSALGFGASPGAIPNNPVFQGITLYGQVIWAWPLAACSLPPINLSVSSGLEFTIQ